MDNTEDLLKTEPTYEKVALVASPDDDDVFQDEQSFPNDDGIDDDEGSPQSLVSENSFQLRLKRALHATLLPDDKFSFLGIPIVDGSFVIKLLKFIVFTLVGISVTHTIVGELVDDRDKSLRLRELWVFEGNSIISDTVLFFLVGRLWKQRGIDHIAWVGLVALCNLYFECQQYFTWLQHSVALYEMHCEWPWQLWLFVIVMIPLTIAICFNHIKRSWQTGIILMKLTEMAICFFFFLLPLTASDYFHMHHWYAGWLFGMHANFDVWWSRAVMAWAWGAYINGIAVYGRDPVLTCQYAYFLSTDQSCPYMTCYLDAMDQQQEEVETNATHGYVAPMVPPDWRNCSADSYHG